MMPMADNLNHKSIDTTKEIICLSLHCSEEQNVEYDGYAHHMGDYSEAFRANNWSKQAIEKHSLKIKGRFDKKLYEHNKLVLGPSNVEENLNHEDK